MSKTIENLIAAAPVTKVTRDLLEANTPYFESVVARYSRQPELIEIPETTPPEVKVQREQLRQNPTLIIDTFLRSAEQIVEYQNDYRKIMIDIATKLGISGAQDISLEKLVPQIQATTFKNAQTLCHATIENGGKVLAVMMGVGSVGKGTLINKSGVPRVVNDTTRPRRSTETEGIDYNYHDIEGCDSRGIRTSDGYDVVTQGGKIGVLADLTRTDVETGIVRGRYVTTVKALGKAVSQSDLVLLEQSPEYVDSIAKNASELVGNVITVPVCVIPPPAGMLEVATRLVVRTYGDPVHNVSTSGGYEMDSVYIRTTMGPGQLKELAESTQFVQANESRAGIAYLMNDDLSTAVDNLKSLGQ